VLRLPEMAAALDDELAAGPRADDTRLSFLWRLLEPQVRTRRERSVERRLRDAHFPAAKTLEGFDFAFQPTLDRDRILELATLDFVRRGENVLFGGMSGTGKSHLAIALGHAACASGFATLYTTSAEMLERLHSGQATGGLAAEVSRYTKPAVLVIDEVGLDQPERERGRDGQLMYKAIAPRYSMQRTTIVTSNIRWEDWGRYLGDDVSTVAIIDRLIHRGHLVNIEGPSWRAHEHEKLNTRPAPSAAPQVGP
jgi:DNA replication protein DnaC